jgi:hypothetical protein
MRGPPVEINNQLTLLRNWARFLRILGKRAYQGTYPRLFRASNLVQPL